MIKKKAFVTYLCSDSFIKGALTLKYSLEKTGTTADIVCMITSEVSNISKKRLLRAGFKIKELSKKDKIYSSKIFTDRYKDDNSLTFTKLNIWKLEEYEKIVYIDADCIVLENIDYLFDYPGVSARRDKSKLLNWEGINAGVMVIKPSRRLFKDMLLYINSPEYPATCSDQAFLSWYLQKNEIFHELPTFYNVLYKKLHHQNRLKRFETLNIKVLHFNGQKPWLPAAYPVIGWRTGEDPAFRLYRKIYEEMIRNKETKDEENSVENVENIQRPNAVISFEKKWKIKIYKLINKSK